MKFYIPFYYKEHLWNRFESPVWTNPKEKTKARLPMRMTVGLSLCLRMWRRVGQHGALTSASDRTMHRRRIFGNSYNPFTCDVYAFGWRVSGGRK